MKSEVKNRIRSTIEYFLIFFISILFWELMLRHQMVEEPEGFPAFLLFIPAEALFFVALTGFFKKRKINRILAFILLVIVGIFYIAQLLYYKQFDSPFSVSLIKMGGEAITDFWWAFKSTLYKSVGLLLIMIIPVIVSGIFLFGKFAKAEKIRLYARGILVLGIILLWITGVGITKLGGTEKSSAYSALTNAYTNTDTSVEKLGMLTTSVVEAGAYLFRINSNEGEADFTPVKAEAASVFYPTEGTNTETVGKEPETENEDTEEIPTINYHLNAGIDFDYLSSITEDSDIQALCEYFKSKPASSENEYTGIFEGFNLIYICAESFTTYAMDEKVTPTLWEMSHNGIVLNNYYTSFKNTTTNGEFAFSVSLWPDVSRKAANGNAVGSFACSAVNYMPYGLGNIFNSMDVPTYAFHGYISSYYRRCDSWPNLGYKNMKFMKEGLTFKNKWSPGDTELMEQTVADYVGEDRFFTYYMTYSGHGSYTTETYMYLKNNKAVRELLEGKDYSDSEISYFCGNYELDKAMEYLLDRLRESGQLDNTVIVLVGDHIPYNLSSDEMEDMSKKSGLEYDKNFEKYHSTCIIYNSGMTEPIVCDSYCCTVDVLPTVLNLMGIEYDSRLIAGLDVFDSSLHRARLYDGNMITEYVNYNASNSKASWKSEAKNWTEEQKKEYLSMLTSYSDSEYAVSLKLMEKDYYRFVWDNLR